MQFFARTVILCTCLNVVSALPRSLSAALPGETKADVDARMAWWRNAKFGMFIHWGLYAVPGGVWKGKPISTYGEWIMHDEKIPVAEYERFVKKFNPVKYDARRWVQIAKNAGMKYIVITSKHHEGFGLFDSKLTDYDVMSTPYGRDLLKPLADECRREGLQICWYHSILDWHHPDANGQRWPKYRPYLKGQLKELLTHYGPIGVLWFDGEWIPEWDVQQGKDLETYIRGLQPSLIVNNRVGKRRRSDGDFGTPEQEIPPTGIPGFDWETNMTMNDTWGFKKHDHNWKSTQMLLQHLVDIVSKGGNFLLNVGPTAEGEIPPESVERLAEIGKWMETNGESIYGTTASPFRRLEWGRATQKPGKLYLHVFQWPTGPLEVPGLKNKVRRAYLLADRSRRELETASSSEAVAIQLPAAAPDKNDSVVVLEIDGKPIVDAKLIVRQQKNQPIKLTAADASLHGNSLQFVGGYIGSWSAVQDWVSWDVQLAQPGKYLVWLTHTPAVGESYGGDLVISIGNQKLETKIDLPRERERRKPKHRVFVGVVDLPKGLTEAAVRATAKRGDVVLDLKELELIPQPVPGSSQPEAKRK